jgi:hypothetical protein
MLRSFGVRQQALDPSCRDATQSRNVHMGPAFPRRDGLGTYHERRRCSGMTDPRSNTEKDPEKDPDDWVSGDEPMTGAQASYLKTLTEQAREPGAFNERLTKAEASKEIDRLREKVGLEKPDE